MDSGWVGSELIGNCTALCFKKIPAVSTFVIFLPNRILNALSKKQILQSQKSSHFYPSFLTNPSHTPNEAQQPP
jgi:hypothetical protein